MHLLKHSVRGNGNVHVAVDLACRQSDLGEDVTFVSGGGFFDALLREHGVRVVTIPETHGITGTITGARALVALVRRLRPDVLHAHMMSSAVLGFLAGRIVGAPMVTTVHNSFDAHSVLMRLGTVVVAVSESERRLLISRGYRAARVVTVLNGADGSAREALPAEPTAPLRRPSVAVLSGLHPRKAVDDVITAFAEVAPEFPDWHLNIMGWGPDRERLEAQVAQRDLGGSVHFLGSVPVPRPLLEQTDIFATATLADPCPLTVGEARAAGRAVVATAVGGIPELLDHGRAGLLSPAADPAAMAVNLRTLMGDPAQLRSWQQRALEGAEHLTVARMTDDYARIYAGVTDRRHPGGPVVAGTVPTAARLRIAWFVPPSAHFAGIERVVHEIASGFAEFHGDRVDAHVVYASRYDEPLLADPPYTCHVLDADHLRGLGPALRRVVAREAVDVLVCPQVEASVIAWAATRGLGLTAFVPHLHGNPRVEESDGTRRTRAAFAVFRHLVARRSAGVLAVSPSLAAAAGADVARRAPRVRAARNPVRELPRPVEPEDGAPGGMRFLCVGRLAPQKGQDLLLRALARVRADLPGARLTLVGTGPDEVALRRLCADLDLDAVVEFVGYATDPSAAYARADCLVLPSRWEGFGMVLVEALHFGLPLLATDCEFGPADLITDEGVGLLVPGDVAGLADGLLRAARRPASAADAARRRSIAAAYGRGAAAADQLDAIAHLLGDRPGPTGRLRVPVGAGRPG